MAVLMAAGAVSFDAHAQCNIYMSTNQQAIDGYGFSSAWSGTLTTAKNNALYGTLGMSLLRVRIDGGNNWGDEIANAAAAHAAGVKVFGTVWYGPGQWLDANDYLLPEHYADYANWLGQAVVAHNLDWVSPANEPSTGWGQWTSDELRTWIGQYGASLGAPLLAPETCGFDDTYTDAIIDDPVAGPNVSVVAGHGYNGRSPWVHTDPISQGKHVWMTEYYLTGGQNTIGESVAIAQNISDYMNCQFSAYISWWVTDGDTNCNLVYSDGTIYKNGYAMGQFAKWIRPGSTRVSSDYNPSSGVSVTAYNVNGSAVIVAVNANTTGSVNQQFIINNGNGAPFEGYRTSSTQSMADIGSFGGSSNSFTANLPAQSITTFVQTNGTPPNLPPPWSAQDIGAVGIVGSSTYTNSVVTNGVFTVTASGSDIWNTADAFRFVYETNGGNCTIIARVSSEQSTNANAKAGVMIRNSLNPGAANAFIGVTSSNGVVFQYRSSTGGSSSSNRVTGLSAPYWVKLVQSGSTVAGYYSANGTSWTQLGTTTTISLGSMQTNAWGQVSGPVEYAGLAFCNNGNASLGTAAFDNVSAPGWPFPTPSAPTGLTATGGVEQVTLNWPASSYATNYIISRATVSGGPYTPIATSWRGTMYIDYGLVGGTTYYYVVMAVNGAGQSTNSAQAGATPTVNVPSPWLAQDIGSVGLYGSESFTNGVFTVTASGNDIWDTADALRFVYVPVTNNCTIIARVASLQNVDGWSKAGVMIRASLASNAPNAFVAVTPGNGVTWQYRSTTGGTTANATTGGLSAPYWVKLVRSGNTFTGYCSPDGTTWTQQGTATFTMATNAYVGLAVTAHNNSDLCAATFDHVTGPGWAPPSASVPAGLVATAGIEQVTLNWMATSNANAGYNVYRATTSGGPYTSVANVSTTNYTDTGLNDRTTYYYVVTAVNSLAGESANSAQVSATTTVPVPYPWLTRDVGSVGLAGSASFTNGVFTVTGSGADIQNTADAFRFVYVATNSGNCTIIARVASLQNSNGWSKAGVMIRDSMDPGAANAFVAVTPGNGATFQYRSSDGGGCNYSMTSGSAPYWVKLVQSSGTNFTGYCSPDGTNWTQAGSATLTGVTTAYIGLAVTAHNNSALCTATFDNVSFTAITPASLQLVSNWGPFVPSTGDGPISMYVYVPTNVVANPPILVELHYCGGTGPGVFGWAGGLKAAADQYGFIIVAPSASDNSGNARCWNPSSTNALTRYGGGDTQAIVSMVNYAATNYNANTNRVYLVGVSSGAMMTEALLAVYPDVFTAGSEFSGIPAGADDWNGDQMSLTPQQWGNMVRAMYPGYSGYRPRIQLWHGTADTTVSYTNQPEAIKEWSNVLGLSTNANYTETVTISGITNQWTHQVWEDPCSDTILEAWTEINGPHMTDSPWNAQYVIPFLGLNQTGSTDPVIMTCGVPTSLSAVAVYWNQVSLTWSGLAGATGYNIKRSTTSGGPYTLIASGMTTNNFTDTGVTVSNGYYYVVSAIVGGSETGNSLEAAVRFPKLTGTIIGTAGSWGGSGNTISNVFDNNLNTYFDAPSADGAWVGLDFGVGVTNVITKINYCPRSTLEWRMTNGVFQGANNTNFTGAVTLFTITNSPASGAFTSVSITNTTASGVFAIFRPTAAGATCPSWSFTVIGGLRGRCRRRQPGLPRRQFPPARSILLGIPSPTRPVTMSNARRPTADLT